MRRLTALAVACVAAFGLMAHSADAKALRVAHSVWVGYGPLFVAKAKGYFKDEGVDVKLIDMEDPKLRFAALAAGRLDVLATTVDTMPLYLKPGGIKYQYLFALDDSNGGDGIIANKSIKTIAELKGKKVAFDKGSVSEFYLNVLLKKAGLKESDLNVVNMTAGDAGSAFVTGKVDAAVTWEPWLTRGKQSPHGHLLANSSTTPGLISDVMLAPESVIKSRAKDLKALYRAWVRAVDFVKKHPKEGDAIMAKGVGGWLKKPSVFAETLKGVDLYDGPMNEKFMTSPDGLLKTLKNALDVWGGFGKLQVNPDPKSLISLVAVSK